MKFTRYFLICISIFLWISCGSDKDVKDILSKSDALLQSNPDSAFTLLESVEELDVLSDETFAAWCLANANVRDILFKEPLSTDYMLRAFNYLSSTYKCNFLGADNKQ